MDHSSLMTRGRASAVAAVMLGAVAACATNAPTNADKAGGGPQPITLRVASPDPDHATTASSLKYFAAQVEDLSGARIHVQITFNAVGDTQDFEAATIALVRDETFDLGWVGARAWDSQDVSSFDALQAPFLITTYPLLHRVVSSPLAEQMLAGLDKAGFVGLGIYSDQLRHPLGFHRPLRSIHDLAGARIRVPTSVVLDATFRALGAVPVHLGDPSTAIDAGAIDGADTTISGALEFPLGSFMTLNITPYAKTITLFASAKRFASLSDTERAILREAAKRALQFDLQQDPEGHDLTAFCEIGNTVVLADDAELSAMRVATEPVVAGLQRNEGTKAMIGQIEGMADADPPPSPTALPPACSSLPR